MEGRVRANAIIRGRVQGVWFRKETRDAVRRFGGISGWVRNRRDGSVEAVFEGDSDRVSKILDWCRKGPPMAVVDDVKVNWQQPTGEFDGFTITY
jgi:acylphosphatase